MRFIALSPGIHIIDGLVLTDLDLNESTNLRFVYFHLSFLKAHHLLVIINLVDLLWTLQSLLESVKKTLKFRHI